MAKNLLQGAVYGALKVRVQDCPDGWFVGSTKKNL